MQQRAAEPRIAQPSDLPADAVNVLVVRLQALVVAKAPGKAYDPLLKDMNGLFPSWAAQSGYYGGASLQYPVLATLQGARNFATRWQDYRLAEEAGDLSRAAQVIGEIVQQSASLPGVIARSDLLAIQNSLVERDLAQRKAVTGALVDKLGVVIETARSADDFTPILTEISNTREPASRGGYGYENSLQALRQYVVYWQDYLLQLEGNHLQNNRDGLQQILSDNTPCLLPIRSKASARAMRLAERHNKPAGTTVTVPDPKELTFENLETYAAAFRNVGTLSDQHLNGVQNMLTKMTRAVRALRDGESAQAMQLYNERNAGWEFGEYDEAVRNVVREITLRAVKLQCKEHLLLPGHDESPGDYAKRIVNERIQAKDWQGTVAALEIVQIFDPQPRSFPLRTENSDLAAFSYLISGLNMESAQQYANATALYLRALQCTGFYTPVGELGARLLKLKAEHPAEYADGAGRVSVAAPQDPPLQNPSRRHLRPDNTSAQ